MQRQAEHVASPVEQAGYLEFQGEHLATVLHGSAGNPAARVLLVGPFASERYFSWVPWVKWARFLAAHGMEALRFDYRGVGESTGSFEEFSFSDWYRDVLFLGDSLHRRSPHAPLILHGLELGAVLAGKAFAEGIGDGLLLWSAPASANQVLRRPLSRQGFKNMFARKSAADYIQDLETSGRLEVDGYVWTKRLWQESLQFEMAAVSGARPVETVSLEGTPASVLKGSAMGSIVSVNLDLSDLYAANFEWIRTALAPAGVSQ